MARKLKMTLVPSFYDPARDGVTFGLLSTFLACREKARLFLEGWSGTDTIFALLYGGITHHILQNAYQTCTSAPTGAWVRDQLTDIETTWYKENPRPRAKAEEMLHEALMKNEMVMPEYFKYWRSDFDPSHREWIEIESSFTLPWTVTTPQGNVLSTFLRGRIDGAYRIPGIKSKRRRAAPRLLETKTRSDIDEQLIIDTMPQERQLSTYVSVLRKKTGLTPAGAQLNIIRKPMLRKSAKEDWAQFARRIQHDVQTRPDWYFVRMEMTVTAQEIDTSEKELDQLIADFLLWYAGESGHYKNTNSCVMYRRPCDFVKVCSHGDYTGLVKRDIVFRELEDE